MIQAWYDSSSIILFQTLEQFSAFLPTVLGALIILIVGAAIARLLRRVSVSLLETLRVSSLIKQTPVEHFMQNADVSHKVEEVAGSVVYWLIMLVVLQAVVAVLGLDSLTDILNSILAYIPQVLSSVLVLFLGVLVAGVAESLVKGSIKTIDGRQSRLLGKIASYLIMTVAVLAAISELGIASEFIMILFIGFVSMISLGFGLALGLGGKDIVAKMLDEWYTKTAKEVRSK